MKIMAVKGFIVQAPGEIIYHCPERSFKRGLRMEDMGGSHLDSHSTKQFLKLFIKLPGAYPREGLPHSQTLDYAEETCQGPTL